MKKAGTESLKSAKQGVLCQGAVEKENQEESSEESGEDEYSEESEEG